MVKDFVGAKGRESPNFDKLIVVTKGTHFLDGGMK